MTNLTNANEFNRLYKSKNKTQLDMTLEYLDRYGSITPLEALIGYGCFRLGARIWDLRHAGYPIKSRIADGESYSVYWIENRG